jgi:predicted alpha/beta hydrolase family esterase
MGSQLGDLHWNHHMQKQVLFIQGAGEFAHDAWDSKLVRSLERELGRGYTIRYPRMPNEAEPKYAAWRPVLLEELAQLDPGAVVVGHSLGATMLLRVLAERSTKVSLSAVLLIAMPFIGAGGWPADEIKPLDERGIRTLARLPLFLYHGTADETVPCSHLALYARAIPGVKTRRLAGRDHQLNNDLGALARDIAPPTASSAGSHAR